MAVRPEPPAGAGAQVGAQVGAALAWLSAGQRDWALRDTAYRFAAALDWQGSDGAVVDTVMLRSSHERGGALDPDAAADAFVEAVETALARRLLGRLRYRALAGLAALGGRRFDRDALIHRLLEAARGAAEAPPGLACYRAYAAACADGVPRWLAAGRLAVCLRVAWG